MVNPDAVRSALGIIGNVISFGLFLSPVPTFWRIIKNKDVEQFKVDPYVATVLNCAMWVIYGLPIVTKNNILVVTINGIGLGIELIYVAIFFVYSIGWALNRKKIVYGLAAEAVFTAVVLLIVLLGIHTLANRTIVVGVLCVIFNIIMYFSPLTVMAMVIRTKSVKYMPFYLSLTNFLNGACWTAYACIHFDPWMVIPNGLGALSGVIQLVLYAMYYRTTDWSETVDSQVTKPQVQLAEP